MREAPQIKLSLNFSKYQDNDTIKKKKEKKCWLSFQSGFGTQYRIVYKVGDYICVLRCKMNFYTASDVSSTYHALMTGELPNPSKNTKQNKKTSIQYRFTSSFVEIQMWQLKALPLIMRPGHLAKGISLWPNGQHTCPVIWTSGVRSLPGPSVPCHTNMPKTYQGGKTPNDLSDTLLF